MIRATVERVLLGRLGGCRLIGGHEHTRYRVKRVHGMLAGGEGTFHDGSTKMDEVHKSS